MQEHEIERRLQQIGAVAPRLTPAMIDAVIVGTTYHRLPDCYATVCRLALANGHVVYGINPGPVSAENFNPQIGEQVALEDARRTVWQLEGYLLRQRIHDAAGRVADVAGPDDAPKDAPLPEEPVVATFGEPMGPGQVLPEGSAVDDEGVVRHLYTEADALAQLGEPEPSGD